MSCTPTASQIFEVSAVALVPFLFVSLPSTYKATSALFGGRLANGDGCPTKMGLGVHAAVYFLLVALLMYLAAEVNKSKHSPHVKTALQILPYAVLLILAVILAYLDRNTGYSRF